MKFKIGEVYCISNYVGSNKKVDDYKVVTVKMTDETIKKLVKQLKKDSDKIEKSFENKKIDSKEYFKLLKKPKENKEEIIKLKKKIFKSKKQNEFMSQVNLAMRNYIPENMQINSKPKEDGVYAVYAGKDITSTGKEIHRWYNIGECRVLIDYFDTDSNVFEYIG